MRLVDHGRTESRRAPGTGAHGPEGEWHDPSEGRRPLRVLVSVDSLERGHNALAMATRLGGSTDVRLRVVHVRMWDRMPRGGGRFFLESGLEATAVVDGALEWVWRTGIAASGAVVEAPRSRVADAVVDEAAGWGADTIVVTLSPRRFSLLGSGAWDRVSQEVLRRTTLPVLAVHPGSA